MSSSALLLASLRAIVSADRERLGRIVRDAWLRWALWQPDRREHSTWLDAWDKIPERYREVDRLIGEAVALYVFERIDEAERAVEEPSSVAIFPEDYEYAAELSLHRDDGKLWLSLMKKGGPVSVEHRKALTLDELIAIWPQFPAEARSRPPKKKEEKKAEEAPK